MGMAAEVPAAQDCERASEEPTAAADAPVPAEPTVARVSTPTGPPLLEAA